MKYILNITAILVLFSTSAEAQQDLKALVIGADGKPLKFATVSLLKPSDSTLMSFGISKESGEVVIKSVKEGNYILQAAMLSHKTYYRNITTPMSNGGDLGAIILDNQTVKMKGVEVTAEKIPMLINKDTIEYNAGAFKTKADASVEELLKKLPGVEVDRAGNIKAQGENVTKVFVDGKEFFGTDPKVATRNLPADAINKVQVFDKKSDAAEFTGIDDGSRQRSINLKLKDDKKNGYFGDLQAGGGTDERFKASGKLYKFRPTTQLAVLGMVNNINRSGFSFSDYINFSGGLQGLMSGNGGGIEMALGGDDNMPVNFGQPVNGNVTSGAGGINYSYEPKKNKRISVSYLGNGADKKLNENTYAQNFTNDLDYITNSNQDERRKDIAHRLNLSLRNDLDTFNQIMLNANANTSTNSFKANSFSESLSNDIILNNQSGLDNQTGNAVKAGGRASFTNKSSNGKKVLTVAADGNYSRSLNESEWNNMTQFLGGTQSIVNNQFRDDKILNYDMGGSVSWTAALGNGFYINPILQIDNDKEVLNRRQGLPANETDVIDTLSPDYNRTYTSYTPGLTFRKSAKKVQYSTSLKYQQGVLSQSLNNTELAARNYGFLLPSFNWRNQYATGKHINFSYHTQVKAPSHTQLMEAPVVASPLSLYRGNANLNPEYSHSARASWMFYDQFTSTSLFTSLSGTYTHNKINRSVIINNDLSQVSTMVNVPDDYTASANVQFSRPIRSLGIKTSIAFSETYNRGINIINSINNFTTSYAHQLDLKIGNRKKEKWDVEVGAGVKLTDVKYSIQQSLNNVYLNTSGFTELSYKPNDKWYFMLSGDVTRYTARSFQQAVTIPLLRSEISYYFMKANRAVLTLEGFDLLNQNKALQRISQQNYLAEVQSNIIGQYFMLSFKYRLNQTGKKNAMFLDDININIR